MSDSIATNPSQPLIPFAQLLAQRRIEAADRMVRVEFDVTEDWAQGRTAFGGLTSAFGVQAMRDLSPSGPAPGDFELRALQTSFVAPVTCGTAVVETVLLREGRNVRQVQATLRQQGEVAAVMLGTFAKDRASSMQTRLMERPPASHAPDRLQPRRRTADSPQFLRHFDLRWDFGPMPGSSDPGLSTRIHMRLIDREGLDDEMLAVLLADVSPTPATGQFDKRPAASSVSWALELRPLRAAAADGWWRADNDSIVVDGGYVNHTARLWAPSGELAALAYQVVAIFG